MKQSRRDGHSEYDTHSWNIEKTKSGDDKLKCPECGSLLLIDHVDHSSSPEVMWMLCGGCGNEYQVTESPSPVVEDWKIRASRKLAEKLKNLHAGTEVRANIVLNCRIKGFNELGNKVSIEFPIKQFDGNVLSGGIDEWVPINCIEIIELENK